jgi:hypothetical protein
MCSASVDLAVIFDDEEEGRRQQNISQILGMNNFENQSQNRCSMVLFSKR